MTPERKAELRVIYSAMVEILAALDASDKEIERLRIALMHYAQQPVFETGEIARAALGES